MIDEENQESCQVDEEPRTTHRIDFDGTTKYKNLCKNRKGLLRFLR